MVPALYIFKIWLCICELRGNSLYVLDNSAVQLVEEDRVY